MRVLLQRVKGASVEVDGTEVAFISRGYLLLVGIGAPDGASEAERLARKISQLRLFPDEAGKMNLDIRQVQGEILSVSQFTLYADISRGNRPGFEPAARPEPAAALWREFNERLRQAALVVKEGVFGAAMQVRLINDGPVTIWLDSQTL